MQPGRLLCNTPAEPCAALATLAGFWYSPTPLSAKKGSIMWKSLLGAICGAIIGGIIAFVIGTAAADRERTMDSVRLIVGLMGMLGISAGAIAGAIVGGVGAIRDAIRSRTDQRT